MVTSLVETELQDANNSNSDQMDNNPHNRLVIDIHQRVCAVPVIEKHNRQVKQNKCIFFMSSLLFVYLFP